MLKRAIRCLTICVYLAYPAVQDAAAQVVLRYYPTKTAKGAYWEQTFKESRLFENLAEAMSRGLVLPAQLTLALAECGSANASYQPRTRTITICYELMDEISSRVISEFERQGNGEYGRKFGGGAMTFLLLHELGHALVHLLDLPITGREEDVADQFATYFLLHMDAESSLIAITGGIWFFGKRGMPYTQRHFAGEHSLDDQRRYNIVCWALGKDPVTFMQIAQSMKLPVERGMRCRGEYERMNGSMRRLLGNNIKLN